MIRIIKKKDYYELIDYIETEDFHPLKKFLCRSKLLCCVFKIKEIFDRVEVTKNEKI